VEVDFILPEGTVLGLRALSIRANACGCDRLFSPFDLYPEAVPVRPGR
jgi:hypothetical protein